MMYTDRDGYEINDGATVFAHGREYVARIHPTRSGMMLESKETGVMTDICCFDRKSLDLLRPERNDYDKEEIPGWEDDD